MFSVTYKLKEILLIDEISCSNPLLLLSLHHGSTWSHLLCQGHFVYFITLIATTCYSMQSLVDSRKLEGWLFISKNQPQQFLFAPIPFFHGGCINWTNWQQQLKLFIKYSKPFRKVIVYICSCKCDFRNCYFLQRATLSEYVIWP